MTFLGVTFAPGKPDGTQWDGIGNVKKEDVEAIAVALSVTQPYAAVLAILARPTVEMLDKPEGAGRAWLISSSGSGAPALFAGQRDSFTPQWTNPPSWSHVPLDGSARIRVEVIDQDVAVNDPAGVFELGSRDFAAAIQAGNVIQVRVAEQTSRQVLFAAISAMSE